MVNISCIIQKKVIYPSNPFICIEEKQKIKLMYSLQNENKHLKILKKLIKLGADVKAHDIYGFTGIKLKI